MQIKFAILRTNDGHAYDLLKLNVKAKAGVGGTIEVLSVGEGKNRVSVNGIEIKTHPAQWPADISKSPAEVTIESIVDDAVVDTKKATVEITGLPAAQDAAAK